MHQLFLVHDPFLIFYIILLFLLSGPALAPSALNGASLPIAGPLAHWTIPGCGLRLGYRFVEPVTTSLMPQIGTRRVSFVYGFVSALVLGRRPAD